MTLQDLGSMGAFWNAILQTTWFIIFLYIIYLEKNKYKKRIGSFWKQSTGYSHKAEIKAIVTLYDGDLNLETPAYLVDFHGGKNGKNIVMEKDYFERKYTEKTHL